VIIKVVEKESVRTVNVLLSTDYCVGLFFRGISGHFCSV